MSFFNKNAQSDETVLVKSKQLVPLLQRYNDYLYKSPKPLASDVEHYNIPNNNQKYYMFSTKSQNFNILYFFPIQQKNKCCPDKVSENLFSDFFIEIDQRFKHNMLIEGYLYTEDSKHTFLASDILFVGDDIVEGDYPLRLTLLQEILYIQCKPASLKHLNNHLTINVHNVFPSSNDALVKVFLDNFKFKDDICALEKVAGVHKSIAVQCKQCKHPSPRKLRVIKGQLSDVYPACDLTSGDSCGILYVKGLQESRHLQALFKASDTIVLECKYNATFKKWQPCFV
jgi:hypothetical protein